jgi:hypothetical protein
MCMDSTTQVLDTDYKPLNQQELRQIDHVALGEAGRRLLIEDGWSVVLTDSGWTATPPEVHHAGH